ncbi:hypothetical protein HR060_18770 [Catenovulum sp. SM1970]|uniref:sensor histidine kinase n=1 Tax=Marinifaba aquimaris TaxID=2741323 RepID=UPI001573F0C0|nr:ATP-binding protein [Marinifaba aquimaris]NTS78889.1 hypothetical protein [Marinifaba aquimaris]
MKIENISIKSRVFALQILTIVILISLNALLWFQKGYLNQSNKIEDLVEHIQVSKLLLRRHEKDFIMRLDESYVQKHQSEFALFAENFNTLETYLEEAKINVDLTDIKQAINEYQRQFLLLVDLYRKVGLDENSGLQGDMHQQLDLLDNTDDLSLSIKRQLFQLKRFELFFIKSKKLAYADEFEAKYHILLDEIPVNYRESLNLYHQNFHTLVALINQIGLDHNSGTEGQMRKQVHVVEDEIKAIMSWLKPELAKRLNRVSYRISILITLIAIFSVLFLFIVGRSITSPLKQVVIDIEKLRKGKRDIKFQDSKDELGLVFKQLAILQAALKELDELRENEQAYQAQLISDKAKIEEALDEIKAMQGKLVQSEKLASLGSLVAGVAHEINTPIGIAVTMGSSFQTSIKRFLEKLETGKMRKSNLELFRADIDEGLGVLLPALDRASTLIHSFKQVAIDQSSEEKRAFKLSKMIQEVMLTLAHQIKRTDIELHYNFADDIEMSSYPGPLGQVITNLFNNAVIHGFDDLKQGQITITTKQLDDENVLIEVEDTGKGIEPDYIPKIFDPFFTTKLGQGGSGLGLSIIYNIVVSLLGGDIKVSSKLGEGTRFSIQLPINTNEKEVEDGR